MIGTAAQRRVTLTLLDQLVSSTSNFVTGVVVARLSGPAEFGRYMLMFTIWLVAVGVHRALITEPLIVTSRHVDVRRSLMARGLSADLLLGMFFSAVVATGGGVTLAAGAGIGMPMVALSPWFVPLLVQDYWRGMAFQHRRPGLALANDLVFAIVQIAVVGVFSLLGWRTASHMLTAWGLGAMAGALLGYRWFPAIGRLHEGKSFLTQTWSLSRWMLADFLTTFASHQSYVAFAALLLSQVDYGGFRAGYSLMGPVIVILHAAANVGLPEAARRANPEDPTPLRRFARRLSVVTSLFVIAYAVVVAIAGKRLLSSVFGSEFAPYGLLATLAALQYVVAVSWFGQGIALKAAGRMRRLWRARLVVAVISLILLVVLVRWLGTIGAGWAGVITAILYSGAVYAAYRTELS